MPIASEASPSLTKAPPPKNAADDTIDEKIASARFAGLKKRVWVQTWILLALGIVLALVLPFTPKLYVYYAMDPDKKITPLVGLSMPNMTNRAILSWSTSSITEIMTMGFGDMDTRLPLQKWRFTKEGWSAFGKAFVRQSIGEKFKQSQLVLTTAPANTPVIIWQGVNPDQVYEWIVQMPVIMTYATNNNVTDRKNDLVTLTIVRVPVDESSIGIAIDGWRLGGG